ncbi:hypothetical protein H310_15281 [Aphanomyces invadans]|uniref:Uncharacterized protein n=1 Tax=Aphanomyces invadans TaxID=157072 RepID=A0A024T7J8_9STRA|nr:hypothetical protein H310_15281 [Aphanomyces invadans]ETV89880.1 hypothetical protein H310_15281 [Aphanomyces invadans]|eukprot:XP_008881488.1 hypothetical protein H310_15281 [Aphanomyces invadans]
MASFLLVHLTTLLSSLDAILALSDVSGLKRNATNIPKTAILDHIKENGRLKARSNYIKPMLTEKNKEDRMKFALSFLSP